MNKQVERDVINLRRLISEDQAKQRRERYEALPEDEKQKRRNVIFAIMRGR